MDVLGAAGDAQGPAGLDVPMALVERRGLERERGDARTIAAPLPRRLLRGRQEPPQPSPRLSSRTQSVSIPSSPPQVQADSPPMSSPSSSTAFTDSAPWSAAVVPVAGKLTSSSPRDKRWSSSASRCPTRTVAASGSRPAPGSSAAPCSSARTPSSAASRRGPSSGRETPSNVRSSKPDIAWTGDRTSPSATIPSGSSAGTSRSQSASTSACPRVSLMVIASSSTRPT